MCSSPHWMADFALQGAQQSLYDYTAGAAGGNRKMDGFVILDRNIFYFCVFLSVKTGLSWCLRVKSPLCFTREIKKRIGLLAVRLLRCDGSSELWNIILLV